MVELYDGNEPNANVKQEEVNVVKVSKSKAVRKNV
jgi:hypothetical protein